MTEKRFEFRGTDMIDNITGETTLCNKDGFEDVVCQLNEVAEENEQLRKENRLLKGRIMEYEEQVNDEHLGWKRCDVE